jgi:hypothetical protein
MDGVELIKQERARHIVIGFNVAHDDEHCMGELAAAAICYAVLAVDKEIREVESTDAFMFEWWPMEKEWWKPSEDNVRNLVKAGALIAAEIDRLQRETK